MQGGALIHTLHIVLAVKTDHIKVATGQIKGKTHHALNGQGVAAHVFDDCVAGDDIFFIKEGVVKINLTPVGFVCEGNFKGYGVLVCLGAGHTVNGLSALKNAVTLVLKEGRAVAVFVFDFQA